MTVIQYIYYYIYIITTQPPCGPRWDSFRLAPTTVKPFLFVYKNSYTGLYCQGGIYTLGIIIYNLLFTDSKELGKHFREKNIRIIYFPQSSFQIC